MLKKLKGFKIVGINLLAFVIYAIIFFIIPDGFIGLGFFILFHFVFCMLVALGDKNWYWVLSGLIILIISISLCVNIPIIHVGLPPKNK